VQFQHINETVEQFQQRQQPVIHAKKKELIGAQKRRSGMATEGEPVPVKQHDFMDKEKDSYGVRPDAEQRLGERWRRP